MHFKRKLVLRIPRLSSQTMQPVAGLCTPLHRCLQIIHRPIKYCKFYYRHKNLVPLKESIKVSRCLKTDAQQLQKLRCTRPKIFFYRKLKFLPAIQTSPRPTQVPKPRVVLLTGWWCQRSCCGRSIWSQHHWLTRLRRCCVCPTAGRKVNDDKNLQWLSSC